MTERPSWQLDFDCSGCGACCRAIGCPLLVGNQCSIYEDRPDVCRVGFSRQPSMGEEKYLSLTREACRVLEELYPAEDSPTKDAL